MNCPICWKPAFEVPVPGKSGRTQVLCNCGQKNGKFRSVVEYDTGMQPLPMPSTPAPRKLDAWKERRKRGANDVA